MADRLYDAEAGAYHPSDGATGAARISPKNVTDDALIGNRTVKRVIVYTRTRPGVHAQGRDVWWEDEMEHAEAQIEKNGRLLSPLKKWTRKTRCLFYIPQAVPENPGRGA